MSDFEPFDDELAAALRRRSASIDPSGLSTATAHDAVLARRAASGAVAPASPAG